MEKLETPNKTAQRNDDPKQKGTPTNGDAQVALKNTKLPDVPGRTVIGVGDDGIPIILERPEDIPVLKQGHGPKSPPKSRERFVKECTQALFELEAKKYGLTREDYIEQVGAPSSALGRTLGRVVDDIGAGVLSLPGGMTEFAQAFTSSEAVKQVAYEIRAQQADLLPDNPNAADQLLKTGGELATFFIPGAGVARGLRGFQCITRGVATTGGAFTSGVLESSRHAGEVYQELIDKGVSKENASANATKVFGADLVVTTLTNKLGVFGSGNVVARLMKGAAFEGAQASVQQGVHNNYTDRRILEGVVGAALLGSLTGGALQGFQSGKLIKNFRDHKMLAGVRSRFGKLKFLTNDQYLDENYRVLAKEHNLTSKQAAAFVPKTTKDGLTGFGIAEDRIPTLRRAQAYADASGKEALYGELDISNLGGMNLAIGNKAADGVFKKISKMARKEVDVAVKKAGGSAEWFRHGGDEMCVVTTGISKPQLNKAMQTADAKIKSYIKDQKLDDIVHPKHPNDPAKRGVGITYGTSKVDEVIDFRDSLQLADTAIEKAKLEGVRKKTGDATVVKERPPVDKNLPNSPDAKGLQGSRQGTENYLNSLPESVRLSKQCLSPEQVLAATHKQKAQNLGIKDPKAIADLQPVVQRDPVTGLYTRFDRVSSMQRLANHASQTGQPCTIVGFEVRNLAGLNKVNGASIANKGFKEITGMLEKALKRIEGDDVSVIGFRNTGPRGEIQVAGASAEQVNQVLEEFQENVARLSKEKGWDQISHPKDPHPSQRGVGMYTGVVEVHGNSSPASVYHRMDTGLRQAEIAQTSQGR